jgi:Na+-translocating ferredoxin:NAD+ oxidoreductase RnfA subunit
VRDPGGIAALFVLMGIVAVTISMPGYFLIRFASRYSLIVIALTWLSIIAFLFTINAWVQASGMVEYKEQPEPGILMSLDVYRYILAFCALFLSGVSIKFARMARRKRNLPPS